MNLLNTISNFEFYTIVADKTTDTTTDWAVYIIYAKSLMKIKEKIFKFLPVNDVTGLGLPTTLQKNLDLI